MSRAAVAALAAAGALAATGVDSTHAASLPLKGHTKIISVDGPARLTITAQGGRRKIAIRLLGVDTPEPGHLRGGGAR